MKRIIGLLPPALIYFAGAGAAFAQTTFIFDQTVVPFTDLGKLLSRLLVVIFAFAAVMSFLFILIGGIQWISAGGDKIAAGNARDRITAAVIGLVIVVAAFAITLIITSMLGINVFKAGGFDFSKWAPPSIF